MLDFDGPIWAVFGGDVTDASVTAALYAVAELDGPTSTDPFDALRAAADVSHSLAAEVEAALRKAELSAVRTAPLTPHARQVIDTARESGRTVAIVSNNSTAAVEAFLSAQHIDVDYIAGRTSPDPRDLKPSPKLLRDALDRLGTEPEYATLIGDSTTDMRAAARAGVAPIGYANRPPRPKRSPTQAHSPSSTTCTPSSTP